MRKIGFDPNITERLESLQMHVEALKREAKSDKKTTPPLIAVFDADGTLWREDLGEAFLMHQIREGRTPGFDQYPDPWTHYETLHHASTAAANSWIAQMNAGVSEDNLRKQAEECFQKKFRQNVFPIMQKLVTHLVDLGFEIWVCSASIRWAVEPGLRHLGIPLQRLVATEVVVDQTGILTNQVIQPVPYAAGKKAALEKKLSAPPLLVAGNSTGDVEMLAMATELALCITSKAATEEVRASEAKLALEAKKRGWPIQKF